MDLSVVIPAHNAAKFLRSTLYLIQRELEPSGKSYEILIIENGSSDATLEVAKELSKKFPNVHWYSLPTPGKGRAISKGIQQSKGEYICFCDADLEISPEHIKDLISALEDGYQIAIVSKRHPQSVTTSPFRRTILSHGYNLLVRLLFRTGIYSHQDGLKAFKRDAVVPLLPFITDGGWFWDTEMIVLSRWAGSKIKEVPISCDYGWESTFDPVSGVSYFLPRLISLLVRAPALRRKIQRVQRNFIKGVPPPDIEK